MTKKTTAIISVLAIMSLVIGIGMAKIKSNFEKAEALTIHISENLKI